MVNFEIVKDRKRILNFLQRINDDFFPPLNTQLGSVNRYVEDLLSEGTAIFGIEENAEVAYLSYFKENEKVFLDTLWITPLHRKTLLLPKILEFSLGLEKDFNGILETKVSSSNKNMIKILEKLEFIHSYTIQGDMVQERTSFIYVADSNNVREYFRVK